MPIYKHRSGGWRVVVQAKGGRTDRVIHGTEEEAAAVMARMEAEMDASPRRMRVRTEGSMVYFIRCGDSGPIKIGYAVDPLSRLDDLQVAHHERLWLLFAEPGTKLDELIFHQRFADLRIRGEWFDPSGKLLDYIRQKQAALRLREDFMEAIQDWSDWAWIDQEAT